MNLLTDIANLVNNVYKLRVKGVKKKNNYFLTSSAVSSNAKIWHRRLEHINYKDLNKMQEEIVNGMQDKDS